MKILTFARSRNRCLERFLSLSEEFFRYLSAADQEDLDQRLLNFERTRDSILRALDLFDRKLKEEGKILRRDSLGSPALQELKIMLFKRDDLVHKILDVDLQIIGRIERIRDSIFSNLSQSRVAKNRIGRFKSGADEINGHEVDEKA